MVKGCFRSHWPLQEMGLGRTILRESTSQYFARTSTVVGETQKLTWLMVVGILKGLCWFVLKCAKMSPDALFLF